MIFEDKKITLKSGVTATLRTPETADADKMLDYIRNACFESEFLLRYGEEWDSMTVAREEKWIEDARTSPNRLVITCFIDGEVAGSCDIAINKDMKTSHRGLIGIALRKKYWNLGIGSAMFEELITAVKRRGCEIMELEFIEGNDRARHLYEKMGFRIVSQKPNAFKTKDGKYLNEYYMQKYL